MPIIKDDSNKRKELIVFRSLTTEKEKFQLKCEEKGLEMSEVLVQFINMFSDEKCEMKFTKMKRGY